jgi:two-component system response regulator ChvI
MQKQTIALIDDDRNILTSLSIALEKEGFKVQTYIDGESAIKVLIERIRVQLRKKDTNNNLEENKSLIAHGKLKLDPSQLECEWNNKQLPDKLTTTEFLIVKELAKRPGIIKERAQLMDIAYREDTDIEDRTIDSHVKRIRKKFKKVDPDFSAIETRYGSGYRWNVS